jgi:hypothetical protein
VDDDTRLCASSGQSPFADQSLWKKQAIDRFNAAEITHSR